MKSRLRELRELHNMSQREVAEAIHCSTVVYHRYEKGTREPSIDALIQLSALYDVSVDYMIGNTFVEYNALSEREITLIEAFRNVPASFGDDILEFLRMKQNSK